MKFKFIILFFLISIAIIIFMIKSEKIDEPSIIKIEIEEKNSTLEPKIKIKLKKQNPTIEKELSEISPHFNHIYFVGTNEISIDLQNPLEIDQIMKKQKKLNKFTEKDYSQKNDDDWNINYEIGLEDGAIEELKDNSILKPKMLNGKVGFSKSF